PSVASELGALMYASHDSYSACGLGSDATDRLVAMVAEAGPRAGVFGAKITGGGRRGNRPYPPTEYPAPRGPHIAPRYPPPAGAPVVRDYAARYSAETGRPAEVFAESGPGAARLGVTVATETK